MKAVVKENEDLVVVHVALLLLLLLRPPNRRRSLIRFDLQINKACFGSVHTVFLAVNTLGRFIRFSSQ